MPPASDADSTLALFGDPSQALFNSGADFFHATEQPGPVPGYIGRHRLDLEQI